jgi:serine/threonine-protein kinase
MMAPEQLAALSRLWDQARELDGPARDAWLAALPPQDAALASALRAMLATSPHEAQALFLTIPKLDELDAEDLGSTHRSGDIVGPYRLIRSLGSGGMSTVWLAERTDGMVKREVALKLPHPWVMRSHFRERIERERDILACLAHPRIARLYDAGVTEQGQPWLALEHVQGRPVTEHCELSRLDLRARLALFLQVLEAVGHAHERRIVHRDIKPSNILVDDAGQPRLLDFGIAKLLEGDCDDNGLTQLGPLMLTPSYASPEQVSGTPVTEASDVYSLGVLLYELLTGRRPYRLTTPSRASLEEAILQADIEAPSRRVGAEHAASCGTTVARLSRQMRGDLDAIILNALKRAPGERYASVAAFAEDIRRFLDGDAVAARPEPWWSRAGRLVRRHRLVAAASAAVVLSLSAGLVAAMWQAGQAREQARAAQQQRRTAEAAMTFLEQVFRSNSATQADPMAARSTTARELLDRGASEIDAALSDSPEAKLRLLQTLSQMYADMGLWEQGLELARKSEAESLKLHGPTHPATLDAQLTHAQAADTPPTAPEALGVLTTVGKQLDQLGDRDSTRRGRYEMLAAKLHYGRDRAAGLEHAAQAVRVLRKHGPSCDLASALLTQGDLYLRSDRPAPALAATNEALAVSSAFAECDARMRPQGLEHACWAERILGHFAAAERLCRGALALEVRARGPQTPAAVAGTVDLSTVLMQSSRHREAITLMQRVVPIAERLAQREDFGEVNILWLKLGEALVMNGQPREGLATMEQPSRLDHRMVERSVHDAPLMERRAAAMIELGQYEAGLALLDQARAMFPGAPFAPRSALNANVSLRVKGLLARARQAEAALALQDFLIPESAPDGPDAFEHSVLMAQVQRAQGQLDQAQATAQQALARAQADAASIPYRRAWTARLHQVLGQVALERQRWEEAATEFATSLDEARSISDAGSADVADALLWLAMAEARLGHTAQAKAHLSEAGAILAKTQPGATHHTSLHRMATSALAGH